MAEITTDARGNRMYRFLDAAGERQTLRFGKMPLRECATIKRHVDHLVNARLANSEIDRETATWLGDIPDKLRRRLAAIGVVSGLRAARRQNQQLEPAIEDYILGRSDLGPATGTTYRQTKRLLIEKFGAGKLIGEITKADAIEFRLWLTDPKRKDLADNTARKHCARAKSFFGSLVDARAIKRNPFRGMKDLAVKENREREHFVTVDVADKILAACPDAQWRLAFALARYGGLRCPSEHLALTIDCLLWDQLSLRVRSPKTAKHEGKEFRLVPIFPELRPYLEDALELLPPGERHLITMRRSPETNLRTGLLRIIERAGVTPWPRLWQNLRASRATELNDEFPSHVVAAWLGHSEKVAKKHYLQVTDAHIERAVNSPPRSKCAPATVRTNPIDKVRNASQTLENPAILAKSSVKNSSIVVLGGLEPPIVSL